MLIPFVFNVSWVSHNPQVVDSESNRLDAAAHSIGLWHVLSSEWQMETHQLLDCLFAKRLERGRFVWPQADSGTVALTRAQLSMLCEGIDWRRPVRTACSPLAI